MLVLNSLTKYYTNHKAIDDVSFSSPSGKVLGLLGPNGAGKTTLLRMLTGILTPDSGTISLNSKNFEMNKQMKLIGYLPEERGLYKKMKVKEHIIYMSKLKGLSSSDANRLTEKWLDKFDLQKWKEKKIQDLSKGMSQKVQFIATILHDPNLVVLDEPFSGLDPINSDLLKKEIIRLSQNGKYVILSTHRMEQAEELCDKIVLINDGQKVLEGGVKESKEKYKENIFQIRLSSEPKLNEEKFPFKIISHENTTLTVQLKEKQHQNDILKYFLRTNQMILSFNETLPTLEQIFINLITKKS